MKTNEAATPWDPQAEDQKDDGRNFKAGVDQLERDTLRFLELTPDIKMDQVRTTTNMAFPLATESSDRALTNDDFLTENSHLLLEKLGIPKEFLQTPSGSNVKPTDEAKETFTRIICRYLGAHTSVSAQITMDQGLEILNLATIGTDSGFEAQASDSIQCHEEQIKNMRMAVARDVWMNEIKNAMLKPKFGKKFQEQNTGIPLKDLKSDKDRFLKQTSKEGFPLFGLSVIKAVLQSADNELAHQGDQAILDLMVKEKYIFYDKKGNPLDQKSTVDDYVSDCNDCSEVQRIKSKSTSTEGFCFQVPEELIDDVLVYADQRHQGFAEAFKRVKTWVDLKHDPDFKKKVLLQ